MEDDENDEFDKPEGNFLKPQIFSNVSNHYEVCSI